MISNDYLPNPGGIAGHVYELCCELAIAGCDIDLIAGHNYINTGLPTMPLPSGVTLIRNIGFKWSWFGYISHTLSTVFLIRKLLKSQNYDLVHWHNLVWESLGIRLANPRIPKVFTNHSSGFLRRMNVGFRKKYQIPFLLNIADRLITPSEELKEKSIQGGFNPNLITFISNGVNPNIFSPGLKDNDLIIKYSLKTLDKVIIVPRRLDPKNGVDILVKSLPKILKVHKNVKVLLVGDGSQKPLLEKISNENTLNNHLIFCGSQPRYLMPAYLRLADVAILPSRAEAVSLAGLEAMSCGLPVLGSNVCGITEIVKNNETGFLFPSENIDTLAEIVIKFFNLSDIEKKRLSTNSRNFVSKNFSWKLVAMKTILVYEKLLSEKKIR